MVQVRRLDGSCTGPYGWSGATLPLSLIKTLAQAAQGEQGTNATATSAMVLLNITQMAIAIAKAQGVNVTLAEELYSVALI